MRQETIHLSYSDEEYLMRSSKLLVVAPAVALLAVQLGALAAIAHAQSQAPHVQSTRTPAVAVGPQYGSTHVYVPTEDVDRFVTSFLGTLGGQSSKQVVATVTPEPSSTTSQLLETPVGMVSLFGFKTPIPFPFGSERTGYLVTDLDLAVREARDCGADVIVEPFPDPIGRDAIIQWPGGVNMQLYWHTTAPSYPALQTIPENRVYVSSVRAAAFVHGFLAFSHGSIESDAEHAPGIEIGRPNDTYRRIRIQSAFGNLTVLVTDGHLPYPYGRELTGYEVRDLTATLAKGRLLGVAILAGPYTSDTRDAAIVEFPGGYIAEIHSQTTQ